MNDSWAGVSTALGQYLVRDRVGGRMTGENGQGGQSGAGAAVTTEASELDQLACPRPVQREAQDRDHGGRVGGDAEVRQTR